VRFKIPDEKREVADSPFKCHNSTAFSDLPQDSAMWRPVFLNAGLPILAAVLAGAGMDRGDLASGSGRLTPGPTNREVSQAPNSRAPELLRPACPIADCLPAVRTPQARLRNSLTGRFTLAGCSSAMAAACLIEARSRPENSAHSRSSCAAERLHSIRLQI
jgi:hypothetical protein